MLLPSGRLFWIVAAAVSVTAFSPPAGLAGTLLALLAGWVDALRCRGLAPPELDAELTERLGQGQESELRLRLSNRSGRARHAEITIDVPEALATDGSYRLQAVDLPARGRVRIGVPILARRRGWHAVGHAHLRLRGPLGLSWQHVRVPCERAVTVVPGLREARRHRLRAGYHDPRHMGFRNARRRLHTGAFESLRGYVPGDDPRRIDWKVTARKGKTIVRRYEDERNQNVVLCIDAGRQMAEKTGDRERLDHALAAAVVLTDVARVWNDNVGVFVFSDEIQAVLPPGRYPADRIPSLLADVESRAVEPNYPRALVTLSRMVSRRSLLVFFSDVIDEEVSAPLAKHLAQLARRHLPLFVALRNPELREATLAPVASDGEAYHRAAATEMALARAKTLQAMRQAGIQVVDANPEGAVEAAVDRYVQIKGRGAL